MSSCRETVRKALRGLGFSWKKARKLLNKANPKERAKFLEKLEGLFEQTLKTESKLFRRFKFYYATSLLFLLLGTR